MGSLEGYAPQDLLQTVLVGFLGLVALSCGVALLLDAVRWMAGEKRDDPGREGVGSLVSALKDKVVVAVAIAAIAGSGAAFATGAGGAAGSAPSYLISGQGASGWMVEGTAAGSAPTMGEALNRLGEAARGETFEGQIQQDYERRLSEATSAAASALQKGVEGDAAGSVADSARAGLGLSTALLEDMWFGDNAAGIRNYLSGNLLGTTLNNWRVAANWASTYQESYQDLLRQHGAG